MFTTRTLPSDRWPPREVHCSISSSQKLRRLNSRVEKRRKEIFAQSFSNAQIRRGESRRWNRRRRLSLSLIIIGIREIVSLALHIRIVLPSVLRAFAFHLDRRIQI